MHKKYKVHNIN